MGYIRTYTAIEYVFGICEILFIYFLFRSHRKILCLFSVFENKNHADINMQIRLDSGKNRERI